MRDYVIDLIRDRRAAVRVTVGEHGREPARAHPAERIPRAEAGRASGPSFTVAAGTRMAAEAFIFAGMRGASAVLDARITSGLRAVMHGA